MEFQTYESQMSSREFENSIWRQFHAMLKARREDRFDGVWEIKREDSRVDDEEFKKSVHRIAFQWRFIREIDYIIKL